MWKTIKTNIAFEMHFIQGLPCGFQNTPIKFYLFSTILAPSHSSYLPNKGRVDINPFHDSATIMFLEL